MTKTLASPSQVSEIGPRLKGILRQRGLSLSRLSSQSGVSTSALSLIVRGEIAYPRVRTVQRICGALKLPPTALLRPATIASERLALINDDLPSVEGATIVPVVRFDVGDMVSDTGATVLLPASLADGHRRLMAVEVDGGGYGPYVLNFDLVIFDPDQGRTDGDLVILAYRGRATAAVRVDRGAVCFKLADLTTLAPEDVDLSGVIIQIIRRPPSPQAMRLIARG